MSNLLNQSLEISSKRSRRAVRLSPVISALSYQENMLTSAVLPGTIQVTNQGELIVLLRDAQITGGYRRIFNIRDTELNRFAQIPLGHKFRINLKENK